jgi:RNA polymerase sigma factor (TIGR02999 family)
MPYFDAEQPVSDDAKTRATEIVSTLTEAGAVDPASAEELMPLVYDELRRLARGYMSRETPGHTLQPTALVNEAYLRLVDTSRISWQGRTHFFAVGARVMRRLLIDHARGRGRKKRGADWYRVTFSDALPHMGGNEIDFDQLLTLNEALDQLAELDPRQSKVVELRFFGGLTVPEVAAVLGVSQRTVEGDWTHARAWLKRELARSANP